MRSYILTKFHRLNDLRFSSLSAEAERTYDRMYILAGVLDADGLFIENGRQLSHDEIAYRIRLHTQAVTKSIKELHKANILHVNGKGPQIVDWKKEQIDLNTKREKDRGYQAKHRASQAKSDNVRPDSNVSGSVSSIERETQTQTQTLLSLSKAHREIVETQHPEWIAEAIRVASSNDKTDPKYIAGILRNWITEGRKQHASTKPKNGNSKRANKQGPVETNYSASDRENAKHILAAQAARKAKANV
jgi:DnaD/phage-associated family protein